jgi:hypothetical protein
MCSLTPGRAHAISVGLRSTHEVCRRRRCGGRVDACGERLPLILIPFTQQNPSHHAVLHKTKVRGPPLPVFTSPHLWSGGWQRGKSEGRRSKAERRPKPEPRSGSGFGLRISELGLLSAFGLRASDFKPTSLLSPKERENYRPRGDKSRQPDISPDDRPSTLSLGRGLG